MHRSTRSFDRAVNASVKRAQDDNLDRLGLTDLMWETLLTTHHARLNRARGLPAPSGQKTLSALQRRGLVTWSPIAGEDPIDGDCLWSCTPKGAALVMKGRP